MKVKINNFGKQKLSHSIAAYPFMNGTGILIAKDNIISTVRWGEKERCIENMYLEIVEDSPNTNP